MGKLTNGDEGPSDAEEYVMVQSCIDEAKGEGMFVLVAADNMRYVFHSSQRVGYFAGNYKLRELNGQDSIKIILWQISV